MPDDNRVKGTAGQPEDVTKEGVGSLKGDAEKRGETGADKGTAQGAADIPKTG